MIALDTNVLVRLLVRDDLRQGRRAAALVEGALDAGEQIFVPEIALVEAVWVLDRRYRFERREIATALLELISSRDVELEDRDRVHRALRAYERGRGGFSDYLIREQSRSAGCDTVYTFDRKLLREDGFAKV
jgi:predicted nucleic-acid-binding protein